MSVPIRSIVEDRLAAYLEANMSGVAIHRGVTDETRVLPIVIVHATNANKPNSFGAGNYGNYRLSVTVYVYTSADDESLSDHRTRVETVEGLLSDLSSVQTAWGTVTEYGKLYSMWIETDNEGMQGRKYGNAITYTLFASMPTAS